MGKRLPETAPAVKVDAKALPAASKLTSAGRMGIGKGWHGNLERHAEARRGK